MKRCKNKPTLMNQLKHEWCELDLACKSALIIGALLLAELIFAIFFEPITHHPSIAAIFRTSLSSIFGYILGMNIPHSTKHQTNSQIDHSKLSIAEKVKTPPITETESLLQKEPPYLKGTHIRIVFATFVCITCLMTLLIANLTNHLSYNDGMTQIGHLVSTTIGFLISGISYSQ